MSQPGRPHPFLGREREIEGLQRALESARSGRSSLQLIAGEAGIGKTRTASELAEIARGQGFTVLWARELEGDVAPAYWLWSQVMAGLEEAHGLACLRECAAPHVAELARLTPALEGPAEEGPERDPAEARMRFFDAVVRFLSRMGGKFPLLVVFDDLHWADTPSLLLLEYVASHLRESRVAMVGTYRDTFLRRDDAMADCLGRLTRVGERLPLTGLSSSAVRDYLRDVSEADPDPDLVERIREATGGNPFFVSELVRLLRAEGRLEHEQEGEPLPLPREVGHAVRRRLDALTPECRQALQLASVLGAEPDVGLAANLSGLSESELLEAVEEAIAEGLVAPWGRSLSSFRFAHGLVCEALYADLAVSERTLLHRQAAEALEQRGEGDGEQRIEELARHYFEAARLGDAGPAVHYAVLAGQRAVGRLAYEQAAVHFEHALEAAGRAQLDGEARARILLALGDARWRTGSDPAGARSACMDAAQAAEEASAAELLAAAAFQMGNVSAETGVVDEALVSLLERALAVQGEEPTPLRVNVCSRLATALYFSRDPRRNELAVEAVELARKLGDDEALVAALIARHFTGWGPDTSPDGQLAVIQEAVDLASAAGLRDLELESRAWCVYNRLEMGDLDGALEAFAVYDRRGTEARTPRVLWHIGVVRACLAILRGSLGEAESLAGEARELGIVPEPANAFQFFGIQLFEIRRAQGRSQELAPVFEQLAEQVGEVMPVWRCARALARSEGGRHEEARAEVELLRARGFDHIPRDANWLPAISSLAIVCRGSGCPEAAEDLYERLLQKAGQMIVVATSASCLGSVDHFLGLLAAACERHDEAAEHFERALELHDRMGAPILAARTRFELATTLSKRGADGDAQRARSLAAESASRLEALGLPPLEAKDGDAAVAPVLEPDADAPRAASLKREGEYWSLGFDGSSMRLKDRKGLSHLAELLSHPGREFHALDLVRRIEKLPPDATGGPAPDADAASIVSDSDSGEHLDAQARADYQARLEEIVPELEEAEANGDARAEILRAEVEAITAELAGAYGLAGRERRSGSVAERARVNVTRALRSVLKKIAEEDPGLGRYLETTISTGIFCSYEPDPRFAVEWELEI